MTTTTITVNHNALLALQGVAKMAEKAKNPRWTLHGILIDLVNSRLVATQGNIIISAPFDAPEDPEPLTVHAPSKVIMRTDFKLRGRRLVRDTLVKLKIDHDTKQVHVVGDRGSFGVVGMIEGKYPDGAVILDAAFTPHAGQAEPIVFNPLLLTDISKAFAEGGYPVIRMTKGVNGSRDMFKCEFVAYEFVTVLLMPCFY